MGRWDELRLKVSAGRIFTRLLSITLPAIQYLFSLLLLTTDEISAEKDGACDLPLESASRSSTDAR